MTITIAKFTIISGPFFANCMSIFNKIEVQTVILVCLTGINLFGSKVMAQNANLSIFDFFAILYKNTLLRFLHFFILYHN